MHVTAFQAPCTVYRESTGTYAIIYENESGYTHLRYASGLHYRLCDVPGDDWVKCEPVPQLGEPLNLADAPRGMPIIVTTPEGKVCVGLVDCSRHATFTDGDSIDRIHAGNVGYTIYLDPRPLPPMPVKEKTLAEKVRAAISEELSLRTGVGENWALMHESAADAIMARPEIAALLKEAADE